jgi:hypothetical protein
LDFLNDLFYDRSYIAGLSISVCVPLIDATYFFMFNPFRQASSAIDVPGKQSRQAEKKINKNKGSETASRRSTGPAQPYLTAVSPTVSTT